MLRCAVPIRAMPWQMAMEGPQKLAFTIPLMEPLPPQYYVRLVSDNWLQVRAAEPSQLEGQIKN